MSDEEKKQRSSFLILDENYMRRKKLGVLLIICSVSIMVFLFYISFYLSNWSSEFINLKGKYFSDWVLTDYLLFKLRV